MVSAGDAVRYRVRLRDVAKQAGVAPSTASAVLERARRGGPDRAADPGTGAGAAAELGYRPNLAARNLRSHTSRIVGLVSDAIAAEPYAGEMVRGAYASALTARPAAGDRRDRRQPQRRGRPGARHAGPADRRAGVRLPLHQARAAVDRGHRAAGRAPQLPGRSPARTRRRPGRGRRWARGRPRAARGGPPRRDLRGRQAAP